MNKKTKIVALLLTLVMLVCAFPLAVFASDEELTDVNTDNASVTYDTSALEELAGKSTGSFYSVLSYETLAGENYLNLAEGSATGTNGAVLSYGEYKTNSKNVVVYSSSYKTLTTPAALSNRDGTTDSSASSNPYYNNSERVFKLVDGEAQFIDPLSESDITVTYVPATNFQDNTRYIVFSLVAKLGANMPNDYFARIRLGYTNSSGTYTNKEIPIAINTANGLKANNGSGTKVVDFSTSVFTTITAVYDREEDSLTSYVNGINVGTQANSSGVTATKLHDISWKINTLQTGHYISLKNSSCLYVNDEETLAKCINEASSETAANGVFNIDGDYYFFKDNIPVVGKTITTDGYTIVTEAGTGKIVKCYEGSVYERWESADYTAAGITLIKDNEIKTSYSAGATKAISGYLYTGAGTGTVTNSDGSISTKTYYTYSPEKTTILDSAHIVGTTEADGGFTFTAKKQYTAFKYYSSIPTAATVTDSEGNTIANATLSKPSEMNNDLSYYPSVATADYTTAKTNIDFRLKAGDGIRALGAGAVRLRYYTKTNGTASSQLTENIGKVVKDSNGEYHLYIGNYSNNKDFAGYDCGILRKDTYTDFTVSMYLTSLDSDGTANDLVFDIYANGVLIGSKMTIKNNVDSYKPNTFGSYIGANYWSDPLWTWGKFNVYSGDKQNTVEAFDKEVVADDSVYTYENGILTSIESVSTLTEKGFVHLQNYSVTLGATLGMNFYAKLPANAAKAIISVGSDEQTIDLAKLSADDSGIYKLSSKVSSINVDKQVKITFYDANNNIVQIATGDGIFDTYITSVTAYAKTIIANANSEYSDEEIAATKAMVNYAAYAEKYFKNNATYSTAYSATERKAVADTDAALITGTVYGESDKLGNVKLVLNDATKIRIYLNDEAVVTSENANVVYVEKDGKYYIDICGIDAKNLDTVYELNIDTDYTVKISVLGVASVVAGDSTAYGNDFVNLMKALYLYSVACEKLA